jgi:hypothetical protein
VFDDTLVTIVDAGIEIESERMRTKARRSLMTRVEGRASARSTPEVWANLERDRDIPVEGASRRGKLQMGQLA